MDPEMSEFHLLRMPPIHTITSGEYFSCAPVCWLFSRWYSWKMTIVFCMISVQQTRRHPSVQKFGVLSSSPQDLWVNYPPPVDVQSIVIFVSVCMFFRWSLLLKPLLRSVMPLTLPMPWVTLLRRPAAGCTAWHWRVSGATSQLAAATYTMAEHWMTGLAVLVDGLLESRVEFLLSVTELLFLSLTVDALQGKTCQDSLLSRGVGQLKPTFQGEGVVPGKHFLVSTIWQCKLHRATCRRFDTIPACDRRTDRQTWQTELLYQ